MLANLGALACSIALMAAPAREGPTGPTSSG